MCIRGCQATSRNRKKALIFKEKFIPIIVSYELIKIYADTGKGTSVCKRPEFIEMMEQAGLSYEENNEGTDIFRLSDRKPKFDIIIVKDASRFSRNIEIGLATVNRLLDKNVKVLFENANLMSDDDNAQLLLPFLFTLAENESRSMSKRIKFSKRYIADQKKEYKSTHVAYGYQRNEDGEFSLDDEKAEVVRYIFSRIVEVGGNTVARELNEQGHKTTRGATWTGHRVLRIVKNTLYYGTATVQVHTQRNVTDTRISRNAEDKQVKIPDGVPPIVSKEEWEKANEAIEKRINNGKGHKQPAPDNIYYKKLVCDGCDGTYVRNITRNNKNSDWKISYICYGKHKRLNCTNRGVALNVLNRSLDSIDYYDVIQDENHMKKQTMLFDTILRKVSGFKREVSNRIDELETKKKELNTEINRITDRVLGDNLNDFIVDALNKRAEEISMRVTEIDKQLINLSQEKINEFMKKFQKQSLQVANVVDQKSVFDMLVNVTIYEDKLKFRFSLNTYSELIMVFNELVKGTRYEIEMTDEEIGIVEITTKRM